MFRIIIAASTLALTLCAATNAAAVIIVREGPPPLRAETVPEARAGRIWVTGHWEWRNNQHRWIPGTWIRERRGYIYSQPTWIEQDGVWRMQRGAWRRGDRDGDGVPNRQDRAPDNPTRY